jgi:hypothetical protein
MRIVAPSTASGALTAGERADAQRALDGLQDSNISLQLATITTKWAQNAPATCRVGLVSRNPNKFKVYVFWVPWLAAEPYIWLNMNLADDPRAFTLGTTQPVLPGGRLTRNGRSVNRLSVDTTLLSRYGPEQAEKGRRICSRTDLRRPRTRISGATLEGDEPGSYPCQDDGIARRSRTALFDRGGFARRRAR